MKTIFLVSKHQFPLNLTQLTASTYYEPTKDQFYRLNVMPSLTVFASQDVQKRQLMVLHKMDPLFLMISQLYSKRKLKQSELPQNLKNKKWDTICNIDNINGENVYTFNKQKTYDLLQKKIQKMQNFLYEKNPLDRIKLLQLQAKSISSDTIILLKNQLNADLINDLIRQRYNYHQNKKREQQYAQVEATKPKPSKNNKKPEKTQQVPKNQTSLFSFMGKAKK